MDIHLICIVLSLLLPALKGEVPSDDGWSMKVQAEVRAVEGYPVVLPCSFSHPQHTQHSSLWVLWRLGHGQGAVVLFRCSSPTGGHACQTEPDQDHRYRLEGNPREHDLSLRINGATLQDNGRYYCRVEVPGHAHASYEDKMGTRLRVESAPRILDLSVEGSEDSGYTASCRVQGSPLPDIQWLDPDKLLEGAAILAPLAQAAPSGPYHTTSQLQNVLPGHQYTCSASNPLGKEQATLYVLPPKQVAPSSSSSSSEGVAPPLFLLLSISLGAKLLLLLGLGVWMVQGGALQGPSCWWK